jgi:hypothetical protein
VTTGTPPDALELQVTLFAPTMTPHLLAASSVPLRKVVELTVAPAGNGMLKRSKPLLLTTRGSGPPFAGAP